MNTEPPKNEIRVLLVDDDNDVLLLIQHLLRKIPGKKFEVQWAATFQAGLDAIAKQEHDVYLVDHKLGAETGLELLRKANSMGVQAPIIILTGANDPTIIDLEATKSGASDFLLKDHLDSVSLERSIRYSIQHYETLRALQKSNERFRLLFERSLDAIMISEDDGRFIEVNPAACALLRRSREELLQKRLSDLMPTDFDTPFVQLEDNSFGELSLALPDGEHRFAEFSACRFAPNLNLCILRDITERRKLEQEIQEISEREQRRLGQDLHDGLGQMLTGINFLTKVLQQKLTAKKVEPESKEAANIVTLINQALSQTRELARGLCPVVLENNDIHAALQQLADSLEKFFGITVDLVCDSKVVIKDNPVAVHFYRIAQEATTNAIKHGKAKNIQLSLLQSKSYLTLRVKDDGAGIAADSLKKKGMGLRVMQHRARMMGATLEIDRPKEGGTLVLCRLEHTPEAKAAETQLVDQFPLPKARAKKKKMAEA